jgi:hypothetical protein
MFVGTKLHDLPGRMVTGAYILHEGLGKWDADEGRAAMRHGMAAGAFPMYNKMQPKQFTTMLSTAEITTGALLLAPFVPTAVAGLALTGFAGGLVAMYLRTPSLRQENTVWPSQQGTAVAKDSWMLGMGLGFVLDSMGRRGARQRRKIAKAARKLAKEQQAEIKAR